MLRYLSRRAWLTLATTGIPLLAVGLLLAVVLPAYQQRYRLNRWDAAALTAMSVERELASVGKTPDDTMVLTLREKLQQMVDRDQALAFVALVDEYGGLSLSTEIDSGVSSLDLTQGMVPVGSRVGFYQVSRQRIPSGMVDLVWRSLSEESLGASYVVVASPVPPVAAQLLFVGALGLLLAAGTSALIERILDATLLGPITVVAGEVKALAAGLIGDGSVFSDEDIVAQIGRQVRSVTGQLRRRIIELEGRLSESEFVVERQRLRVQAVRSVIQEVAGQRDADALGEVAVKAIGRAFRYPLVALLLVDDEAKWAVVRAVYTREGTSDLPLGARVSLEEGLSPLSDAVRTKRPALSEARRVVDRLNTDTALGQSLALPLVIDERVIALLDIRSPSDVPFSEDDVSILHLFSGHLAALFDNAQRFQSMQSTLTELRNLQADYTRQGWARLTQRLGPLAYEYDRVLTRPVPPLPVPDELARGEIPHKIIDQGNAPMLMEALRVGDQVLGYVSLADSGRVWSDEELELLAGVSEQVALALENARLFEDTRRNERQQALISRVLQAASNPDLSTEQVLSEIATILAGGLGTGVILLTLPATQRQSVEIRAAVTVSGDPLGLPLSEIEIPTPVYVFLHGLDGSELAPVTALLERMGEEDRLPDGLLQAYDLDQALFVPMRVGGELAGSIVLIQEASTLLMDLETRELAERLANQIAVVLENLTLSEETRERSEELRELYRISLRLNEALDPDDVLRTILSEGMSLLKADASDLWIYDAESEMVTLTLSTGFGNGEAHQGYRLALGEGLPGEALQQGRTLLVDDYQTWSHRVPELTDDWLHGMLAVPIVGRHRPLGVLVLKSKTTAAFDARDANLADLFSAQAAAALENAQLTQEARRRAETFSQLYDAGIDLITILDAEALLERAARWARRVLKVDASAFVVHDDEMSHELLGIDLGEDSVISRELLLQVARDAAARVIQSGESLFLDEPPGNDTSLSRPTGQNAGRLLAVPLRVGENIMGAAIVWGAQPDQFTRETLNLLEFLGVQVSSALQNALQFRRTEQALTVVGTQARYQANVSRAVALLNERGMAAIDEVLRLLSEATGVPATLYYETVPRQGSLFWSRVAAWPPELLSTRATGAFIPVAAAERSVDLLMQEGYFTAGWNDLPRVMRDELGLEEDGAVLALAVPTEQAAPGYLMFCDKNLRRWEEQEIVALQTVAAAFSNTLARERLFEQVRQTLAETEILYRSSAALSEARTYQDILDTLVTETILGEGSKSVTLHLFDRIWLDDVVPEIANLVAYRGPRPEGRLRQRFEIRRFPSFIEAVEGNRLLFISDVQHDPRLNRRARALFHRVLGAESVLLVPLVVGGQRIGFLHADYPRHQEFPEEARRRLTSLAQQAAVAALNIRQLRETEARVRRERLIREVSARIQEAVDVEGVLKVAVQELRNAFGVARSRVIFKPPLASEKKESAEKVVPANHVDPDQGSA